MCGIGYLLAGILCLVIALCTETPLGSLLFGFAGAGIVPGGLMICKYFYWSAPKNKERYEEILTQENIDLHDELYVHLRDKAGHYAYILGIYVISISLIVFSVLGKLGMVGNARTIVLFLSGYLAVQIIAGIVIMKQLMKKY